MLDGLLGRSAFTSKCKSLIKLTRTRIDALRKRAEAKQRFLKQDLAKLLANGLDLNAYGRTEDFIAGLNLLTCYTFIDQSCEYIYKQLSIMQKLGQCPEECRETVASLMFAAARFSDLPELRDLRDAFQRRYGNGLECFVNQVFVEKLASKPPTVEKRIKLLQDIATECFIQWDSEGFKLRMDKPSKLAQDQPKKLGPLSVSDDKYKLPNGNNLFRKNDQPAKEKERTEHVNQRATLHANGNGQLSLADNKSKPPNGNNRFRKNDHQNERIEHFDQGAALHVNGNGIVSRREVFVGKEVKQTWKEDDDACFVNAGKGFGYENHDRMANDDDRVNIGRKERHIYKQELFPSSSSSRNRAETIETKDNNVDVLSIDRHNLSYNGNSYGISNGNGEVEEEASRNKYRYSKSLPPPPYVRSNIPPPPYSKPHNSERIKKEIDDDRDYHNDIPLPKPRSIRRKNRSKSSSSHDDDVGSSEDARIFKSSRRKERKGLQLLSDDDREEKVMDKLLLHYSSKKTDIAKLRKTKSPSTSGKDDEVEMIIPPVRSVSLPREASGKLEPKKVYARANSFHPDSQAKHVHPKLPDYDDLAARFAALRGQ